MVTLKQALKTGRFGMLNNGDFFVVIGDGIVYEEGGYDTLQTLLNIPSDDDDYRNCYVVFDDDVLSFHQAHKCWDNHCDIEWIDEEDADECQCECDGICNFKCHKTPLIDADTFEEYWDYLQDYLHFTNKISDVFYEFQHNNNTLETDIQMNLPMSIIDKALDLLFIATDCGLYSKEHFEDCFYEEGSADAVWYYMTGDYNDYMEC